MIDQEFENSILDEYQTTIVEIAIPFFGCMLTKDFLATLAFNPRIKERKDDKHDKMIYQFVFDPWDWQINQFIDTLDKIFKCNYLNYTIQKERKFTDVWQVLEHLVHNFDIHYEKSGDHRIYSAGFNNHQKLKKLASYLFKIDANKVNKTTETIRKYYSDIN